MPFPEKSLDGRDGGVGALPDSDETGTSLRAVEEDGAGAAIPGVAADLRTGQPEVVAQHVGQPFQRVAKHVDGLAVQIEGDCFRDRPGSVHSGAPSVASRRRKSTVAASRR